jgi:hypothetical protein
MHDWKNNRINGRSFVIKDPKFFEDYNPSERYKERGHQEQYKSTTTGAGAGGRGRKNPWQPGFRYGHYAQSSKYNINPSAVPKPIYKVYEYDNIEIDQYELLKAIDIS